MLLLVPGAAQSRVHAPTPFTGNWSVRSVLDTGGVFAPPCCMTVVQTSASVCATWPWNPQANGAWGIAHGTASGRTWTTTAVDGYGTESWTVTLSPDGKSWTGRVKSTQRSTGVVTQGRLVATYAGPPSKGTACPVASQPPPTTTPRTVPTPTKVSLAIEWSMPRRFGIVGPDGLINYPKAPKEISPTSYRVDLVVRPKGSRPCRSSDAITWVATGAREIRRTGGCRFSAFFPREGRYALRATLKGADGATGTGDVDVLVQDWLIFGLGDSNGSGEGTPDVPAPPLPAVDPPVWHDLQCDRSANSFEAQAARSIENRDTRTSVTFVHLACSGASIAKGMVGPYGGINAGPALAPQVEEMKRLAGNREIDAVLISIGVNDLQFGAMVEHCILLPACQNRGFPDVHDLTTLAQWMSRAVAGLPALYDRLSHELKAAGVPAKNVFISEYFDSTRGSDGSFCNPLIRVDATGLRPYTSLISDPFLAILAAGATSVVLDFDQAEAKWAYENVLVKLNQQVRAAATKQGWRLITGVAAGFRTHGYCSHRGPTDPWIVGLSESFERQHDHNGTLHANTRGNAFTASLAVKALRRELYPGGLPRPPRR